MLQLCHVVIVQRIAEHRHHKQHDKPGITHRARDRRRCLASYPTRFAQAHVADVSDEMELDACDTVSGRQGQVHPVNLNQVSGPSGRRGRLVSGAVRRLNAVGFILWLGAGARLTLKIVL